MNKQEQIRQYLDQTFEALAKINPELANADRRQRANEMFVNAEADFEIVRQKIDKAREELLENYQEQLRKQELYKKMREQGYYQNFEKDNRESRTFAQVQEAYNKLQAILGENASKVYISGGIAPYLLLNRDSGRLHDDIDSGCLIRDVSMIRELFKNTPYYRADWDSLTYAQDGIDYGFELNIDGVPVTIAPFDHKDGKLISYGFDPYTKELKYRESPAENFSDYFTAYKGADGRMYYMTTLEYIKKCKDQVQRPKDIEDAKVIEQIGIRQDVYDRIVAPEIQTVHKDEQKAEFSSETIIKDFSELVASIEVYDTPQDIKDKIEESNIDFNIMFENEQQRNFFIQDLKDNLSSWTRPSSIYFGMKDSLADKSHSMNHLGSRELCSQINEILKGQTTDFANAIRETQIQLAKEELEASKSDEIKAYIGDSKERKLENEINQFLLNHDIAMTRIEIQKSKKVQQLTQLEQQVRSGQITAAEWGKQRRVIELEIDSMNLEQEAREHFTNYQTGARRHQLGENIDKREIFGSDHMYRTTNFEKNRIDNEIALQSGNCTREEYEERMEEIDKEEEKENKRFDNQMKINSPQQESGFSSETQELVDQAQDVLNSQGKDEVVIEWEEAQPQQTQNFNQQQDNAFNPLQPSPVYNPDAMMNPNNNGFGQMGQPMGGPNNAAPTMNSGGPHR